MKLFHALEPKRASAVWGFCYAVLIALTTLYGFFTLVKVPWYTVQLCYMLIIGLGAFWVMKTGELSRIRPCLHLMLLQMTPLLFALTWSMLLWAFHGDTLYVMKRGVGVIGYQLLLLMMVHVAGVMFGMNMVTYTLYGFVMGNAMIAADVVRQFGLGSFLRSLLDFLLYHEIHGALAAMEVQDLTFAFGVILVFLLLYYRGRGRGWLLAVSLLFFVLGWKRSALLGILFSVAYEHFVRKKDENTQREVGLWIGLVLVLTGFVYVLLIYTDSLFVLTDKLGIDMMGRDKMYQLVDGYYNLNPLFPGIGYGKVSTITEATYERAVRGLHSDILRVYIELGFAGYLTWMGLTFGFIGWVMAESCSARTARSYTAIALFLFLTYLTDNTAASYHTQIAWHMVPLALYLEQKEGSILATSESGREKMTVWKGLVTPEKSPMTIREQMAARKKKDSWKHSRTRDMQKQVHDQLKKL